MRITLLLSTMLISATCGSAIFETISDPPVTHAIIHSSNQYETHGSEKDIISVIEHTNQTHSYQLIFEMTIGNI
jgi:hypothetical protein